MSPVIAVILMVAITVVLSATVFVLVSQIPKGLQPAPRISMAGEGDSLIVQSADNGLEWSEFTVRGCGVVPTGNVTAGDRLTGCSGDVSIVWDEGNVLVYSGRFP